MLKRNDEETLTVTGTITNCSHIKGTIHRLGMRFDRSVNVVQFLNPDKYASETLTGRLLHIEQSEPERLLAKHDLSETNIEVIGFTAIEEAISYLQSNHIDRVLSGIETIELSIPDTINSIYEQGYVGPILLTSADPKSLALSKARDLGAGPVLFKPFNPAELIVFLGENWTNKTDETDDLDVSQNSLVKVVDDYVKQTHILIQQLDAATLSGEYEQTLQICWRLKGSGSAFGFPEITKASSAAITALHAGGDLPEASLELRKLREICARIDTSQSERLIDIL